MKAQFDRKTDLLQAFSHLKPEWAEHLNLLIEDLIVEKRLQKKNSSLILARLLEDLCFYQQNQKVFSKNQSQLVQPVLEKKYQSWMKAREFDAIKELFANYAHFQTRFSLEDLVLPPDLFDSEHWYMWGLNKKQLATIAAITGATAGAVTDMAVAGHSFMLGAIGGGLLGFSSAWFGANKLVDIRLKGLPLGGYDAIYGPVKNKNFPYVVIGRFIYLHSQISQRSHALRGQLNIEPDKLQQQIEKLEKSNQKDLHQACDKLLKQKVVEHLDELLIVLF
jgi:hypothetical protein